MGEQFRSSVLVVLRAFDCNEKTLPRPVVRVSRCPRFGHEHYFSVMTCLANSWILQSFSNSAFSPANSKAIFVCS
jgi:hypothetical protein